MQTCGNSAIQVGADVGPLCDRNTTVEVVGYESVLRSKLLCVSHVAVLEAFPVLLVCAESPVKTRIELAGCCAFALEELIEPRRS